jgi:translation elongation factor EF-1alpha
MFNFLKSKGGNREKAEKPIGFVTHFYGGIGVAIVKFSVPVAIGTKLHFKGATTDFTDTVRSIQYDHQAIEEAKKGQEVGIKVKDKVREGDEVYLAA